MRSRSTNILAIFLVANSVIGLAACAATTDLPSPAPTGTASSASSVQQQLDSYWEFVSAKVNGAQRPDVEQVRLIDPFEWTEVQAQCLRDQGFPDVVVLPDGGIKPGAEGAQQEGAYLLARYVCTAKYPIDPKYGAPLSETQIGAVYDYFLEELIPCFEENGYSVPQPPSREVFAETFASDQWSPYSAVFGGDPSISMDEYYRVSIACPRWPTDLYD